MLSSLEVKNFRCLQDFRIPALGKVNLIVGRNNAGKSTVLEAIRLFAGNANRALLNEISESHDERTVLTDIALQDPGVQLPFVDFFSGPDHLNGSNIIRIGDPEKPNDILQIKVEQFIEVEELIRDQAGEERTRIRRVPVLNGQTQVRNDSVLPGITVVKGDRSSTIFFDRLRTSFPETASIIPCSYIPSRSVSMGELARDWDSSLYRIRRRCQDDFKKDLA